MLMMSLLTSLPPLQPPPPGRPSSLQLLPLALLHLFLHLVLMLRAFGDVDVPTTNEIVSAVVAGLGKSKLNISKEVTEFSRTLVTSWGQGNSSLKEELKAAHAEGEAKAKRILDLEAKLAKATTTAHEWHVQAKELETLLQKAKGNEHWARTIVAQSVRCAPQPQGWLQG